MKIKLDKFTDETFPDFLAIYLEEYGEESVFEPGFCGHIARSAIDPGHSIVRGIWDAESGAVLGYCEVQNVKDPEWEIGIYRIEWPPAARAAIVAECGQLPN